MNEDTDQALYEIKVPVFNIERFAIHDGPGIRTTVFLQGCPLRCVWCANPESQTAVPKLMHLRNKCTGCGICESNCPNKAITVTAGRACIDRNKCKSCGKCAETCPNECMRISGEMMSLSDIRTLILRDRDYYDDSGGGVTFSGGEGLLHFKSLEPLLKDLKECGIHIAFETCGQVDPVIIRKAVQYADCFLFDVKSSDRERFEEYTGGDLDRIFDNLAYLAGNYPDRTIVRIPVIPGFNYEDNGIYDILSIISKMRVDHAELLPYHTLGRTKYEQLGLEYGGADKPLDKGALEVFCRAGKDMGLDIKAG